MPEIGGGAAPSITPGHAYVGTSGWAYATWKPTFYPAEIKSKDFLRYYATRFSTLEVNYTFNHLPTEKNIATWKDATPPDFLFALKASQQITYVRQRDRAGYPDAAVDTWTSRLRSHLADGRDVYAYFRHDDTGANALSAERLRDALR